MDPYGPVRYKNVSLFPGGMGMALAEAVAKNHEKEVQIYGEMLQQQMFSSWISQIFDEIPDAAPELNARAEPSAAIAIQDPCAIVVSPLNCCRIVSARDHRGAGQACKSE